MLSKQSPISETLFLSNKPTLEVYADKIMAHLAELNPTEIAGIMGISHQLALKAYELAYDFPHKLMGFNAVSGFVGEAFKAFDFPTLKNSDLNQLDKELRIISSIYGVLKPSDIIKPYRAEFIKPIAPENKSPIQFLKSQVTINVVTYIKENKTKDIINLLPGDAEKCLDWKIIRAFSSVHKVCFKSINTEGKLVTPLTHRLKELRGLMARSIVENDIKNFNDLIHLHSEHFLYSPKDSKPGLPVFITD